jgi:hypothetical protein
MKHMSNILSSASKIVFIILIMTACVAFIFEVYMGKVILETKDFMLLATAATTFYFSYKGSPTPPEDPTAGASAKTIVPVTYAGK